MSRLKPQALPLDLGAPLAVEPPPPVRGQVVLFGGVEAVVTRVPRRAAVRGVQVALFDLSPIGGRRS